ncbi:putative lipoprotein [Shigella sonnei]|nr:putative lipoprotein [Shigella sonnei]
MRRTGNKLCLIAMITATVALTACTPKGSVEQHTRHYVYASDDGFDPNFSTQKADTTRMMVPFFRQFWDMGAKDKATGKSRSDVQQRIQQFHSQEFLNSLRGTTQFAGTERSYETGGVTEKTLYRRQACRGQGVCGGADRYYGVSPCPVIQAYGRLASRRENCRKLTV